MKIDISFMHQFKYLMMTSTQVQLPRMCFKDRYKYWYLCWNKQLSLYQWFSEESKIFKKQFFPHTREELTRIGMQFFQVFISIRGHLQPKTCFDSVIVWDVLDSIVLEIQYVSCRTLQSLGEDALRVETLVASWFAYTVWSFLLFHFVFFETKTIGKKSFRWFAYRLLSANFVYHAPIGLHEVVPQAFLSSSFVCLRSLKLCCAVARQLHNIFRYIYIYI